MPDIIVGLTQIRYDRSFKHFITKTQLPRRT